MKRQLLETVALAALWLYCGCVYAALPGVTIQSLRGDYDDVKERVIMAIEGRGLARRVEDLVADRTQARKDKDWARADQIRAQLDELGVQVTDTPEGPIWQLQPRA